MKAIVTIIVLAIIGFGAWWWYTDIRVEQANQAADAAMDGGDAMMEQDGAMEGTPGGDGQGAAGSNGSGVMVDVGIGAYALSEVAMHGDVASCWTAIDGMVYDLTSWIPQHPGGEAAIVSLCGTDGTAAFHSQHGDNKKQADILATFKIGALAQ